MSSKNKLQRFSKKVSASEIESQSPIVQKLTRDHKSLLKERANFIATSIEQDSLDIIRVQQESVRNIQSRIMNLEDFGPAETTSLKPTESSFDSKNWIKEIHSLGVQLELEVAKLKAMERTHRKYFG